MELNLDNKRLRTKFNQYDSDGNIYCYSCGEYFPINNFNENNKAWFRSYRDRRCKKCKNIQYSARQNERSKNISLSRSLTERFCGLRDRNKKYGIDLDFSKDYLMSLWESQNGLCAISKIKMTYIPRSGRVSTNVSVDRIDTNLGYSKNNIQLVCMAVNQMKSDLSMGDLYYFCENILKNKK